MEKREITKKIIDEVLRYGAVVAVGGTALVVPGVAVALEKPLNALLGHLDKNEQERELRRVMYKMKERGLLAGSYQHGLELTAKGKKRLRRAEESNLISQPQDIWDGWWRIVFYDVPESHSDARRTILHRLHQYGCFSLQQSVLITPFPCKEDIEVIAARLKINQYITVVEARELPNQQALVNRFAKKYPSTKFPSF